MLKIGLLSTLIWLPVVGAVFVLLYSDDKHANRARWLTLFIVFATLLLCIPLYTHFDKTTHAMQFTEHLSWIPAFGISYNVGVDGISMPLIILTVVTSLVVVLAAWHSVHHRIAQYLAAFLIMQGMMTGVFAALDGILFYVFWEASLIPMYLIIGIWGSENRIYATIKFFLFTFLGSVLMLIALIYLGIKANNFSILGFYPLKMGLMTQILIFIAFASAFAVKVPMFPVHTWLPDAHTEAPAGGSVVLAAIMLKMGAYGFLRFNLPITPDASRYLDMVLIALSLIAIVYIGLVAVIQSDMKKLIAYSSIAHMGFVTLAFFMLFEILLRFTHPDALGQITMGIEGGIVMMISHAFISGALFLGVGVLYDRMHTRQIREFGGVVQKMPIFATFFMLFAMANAGLPGTSGFVGEFMVILASFKANPWIAITAATTLVLSASYMLWMYKRVFFGQIHNQHVAVLPDLHAIEIGFFTILAALVLLLGIYPAPLLDVLHISVQHLVDLCRVVKVI